LNVIRLIEWEKQTKYIKTNIDSKIRERLGGLLKNKWVFRAGYGC